MPFTDSIKLINVIRDDADALTATPDKVLSGDVFVGKAKKFETGNIPILPVKSTIVLSSGQNYNVEFGYNPSLYQIKVVELSTETQGTAVAEDIKKDKIAWVNGVLINGSMPLIEPPSVILNCDEHYDIPLGYHDGHGIITAASLSSQTIATSVAADILEGKTAWVNGMLIAGIMPNNGTVTMILDPGQEYIIAEGYHSGIGKISVTSLADNTTATAVAEDIRINKNAWVNGLLVTGTVPEIAAEKIILDLNGTYEIPAGIHGGLGTVTQEIDTIDGLTITPTFEDQTIAVKDKYMTADIIVSGLDAWNYKNFNSDQGLVFDGNITPTQKGYNVITHIPTDNWHDQATNNIYIISVEPTDTTATNTITASGCVFVNNLNGSAMQSSSTFTVTDHIMINAYVDSASGTNSHTFALSIENDTYLNKEYHIVIREVLATRRYGDEHDTPDTI